MKSSLRRFEGVLPLGLRHKLSLEADKKDRGGGLGDLLQESARDSRLWNLNAIRVNLGEIHTAERQSTVNFPGVSPTLRSLRRKGDDTDRMLHPRVFQESAKCISLLRGASHYCPEGGTIRLLQGLSDLIIFHHRSFPISLPEAPTVLRSLRTLPTDSDPPIV